MQSSNEPRLPFEAPIYEMESRLAEMEAQYAKNRSVTDVAAVAEQIRRLRRELAGLKRTLVRCSAMRRMNLRRRPIYSALKR